MRDVEVEYEEDIKKKLLGLFYFYNGVYLILKQKLYSDFFA